MAASDFFDNLGKTLKSVAKIIIKSRAVTVHGADPHQPLIVMGNGPSLNAAIAEKADTLKSHPTLAVNYAACAPEFFILKPRYYTVADTGFFRGNAANVDGFIKAMTQVDWALTLAIPRSLRKEVPEAILANRYIRIVTFNAVGLEGFAWFERMVYNLRLGMPRPRNVLVPAIMTGIWLGYKEIYVAGADHSWMQSIWVNEYNNVVSVQPHFYKDNDQEQNRVDTLYKNLRLHDVVYSFYVAFRSYHTLRRYALSQGIHIYNSTIGSFIDAFDRKPLP